MLVRFINAFMKETLMWRVEGWDEFDPIEKEYSF